MKNKAFYYTFMLLEALFYCFITVDNIFTILSVNASSIVKYAGIFVFAIFCFMLFFKKDNKNNVNYLIASSFGMLIANYFILFKPEFGYIGILFMMIVSLLFVYYATHSILNVLVQSGVGIGSYLVCMLVFKDKMGDNAFITNLSNSLCFMWLFSIISSYLVNYSEKRLDKFTLFLVVSVGLFLSNLFSTLYIVIDQKTVFNVLNWLFFYGSLICIFNQIYMNKEVFYD